MINSGTTTRGMEDEMIEVRKVLIADHIQDLERDAAARSGRRRAPRPLAREADVHGRVLAGTSVRLRVGRWLVGVGEAIAGPAISHDDATTSMPRAA